MNTDSDNPVAEIHEDRRWTGNGWSAQVIKSEDGEGWAVAMSKDGESEPALVGPWTMGRDKKNPKPLDSNAFITLVKTANEFVRRHEQQLYAQLNQSVLISGAKNEAITVQFTIYPDSDEPHGVLKALNVAQEVLGTKQMPPNFKLTRESGQKWFDSLIG